MIQNKKEILILYSQKIATLCNFLFSICDLCKQEIKMSFYVPFYASNCSLLDVKHMLTHHLTLMAERCHIAYSDGGCEA
jgi:hypothetical protein